MTAKQIDLGLSDSSKKKMGPVECLGLNYDSDDARRTHFLGLLREKLQDPEFRKTPGFPVGSDEDILGLSDPPYYTACPNPFLASVVKTHGRHFDPTQPRRQEPFASDVKQGRHEPIYLAHTYHTKVPWKAVLPFVLAYTEPGDIVWDGFGGTGMVGVACAMAGQAATVAEAVGKSGLEFRPGIRHAILSDISTIAGLVASVYSMGWSFREFQAEAKKVLREAESVVGQLYKTTDASGAECDVHYFVWSDVFACPYCGNEETYYELSYSSEDKKYAPTFPCPACRAELKKNDLDRRTETVFDSSCGAPITRVRQELVLRSFTDRKGRRRHEPPTESDLAVVSRVENAAFPSNVPVERIPYMHMTHERNNLAALGVTHSHHFFTRRNAIAIGNLIGIVERRPQPMRRALLFWLTSCLPKMSRLMNYNADGIGRVTKGIFYFASVCQEFSPFSMLTRALRDLRACFLALEVVGEHRNFVSTSAAQATSIPDATVDYVFTDPPFGENIYYADLNYLWETWLRIRTSSAVEAIVSRDRSAPKSLFDYIDAMTKAFSEYHRVLKPGRWITVEFHNSENRVWRGIQEALGASGFVVADVRVLDKKLKTFKQIVAASTMKQDLVISAYKPTKALAIRFELGRSSSQDAWAFVEEHLGNVPVFVGGGSGKAEVVVERTAQMLHDRMIAFHVQRGVGVPISGPEFLEGLAQRFPERDGMYFLPEQVTIYDRKRTTVAELRQLSLFVNDEASSIQWVRQRLQDRPLSFQDLQPQFMRELQAWAKHEETVELKVVLEQNFLHYDGHGPVPSQIHSYLSTNFKDLRGLAKDDRRLVDKARDRWYVPEPGKQADLDQLRDRALLREFGEYEASTQRRIKVFRTEAVRAGFRACWQRQDYATIVQVGERLPDAVLQEDEKLLMYYDGATTRMGANDG